MTLTDLTRASIGSQRCKPADAILISMLPFGIARERSVLKFFTSSRSGRRAINRFAKAGFLERRFLGYKNSNENDSILVLTMMGIMYLKKYLDSYPWVLTVSREIGGSAVWDPTCNISIATINLLCDLHEEAVGMNIQGAQTYFDRVIYQPFDIIALNDFMIDNTEMCQNTGLRFVCETYKTWARTLAGNPYDKRLEFPTPIQVSYYSNIEWIALKYAHTIA